MSDNVTLNEGAGGDVVAADDIAGVKHQRVKVEFGADGAATDVSATNPMPIGGNTAKDGSGTGHALLLDGDGHVQVDALSGVNPTNATAEGPLGALDAALDISAQGAGTVHWEIDAGTLSGTVVFEATLDDAGWFTVDAIQLDGTIVAAVSSFPARGAYATGGYSQMRLRVSAYTSGSSNAHLEASAGCNVVRLTAALPTGTNTIGSAGTVPLTTGGCSVFRSIDLDETEEEAKAAAGQIYGWYLHNNASAVRYVKFYDGTAASVTVGTSAPVVTVPLPANSGANVHFGTGIAFDTGITVAATTGVGDTDTGAPAANDVQINLFYK